jgi:hypothetical protein
LPLLLAGAARGRQVLVNGEVGAVGAGGLQVLLGFGDQVGVGFGEVFGFGGVFFDVVELEGLVVAVADGLVVGEADGLEEAFFVEFEIEVFVGGLGFAGEGGED